MAGDSSKSRAFLSLWFGDWQAPAGGYRQPRAGWVRDEVGFAELSWVRRRAPHGWLRWFVRRVTIWGVSETVVIVDTCVRLEVGGFEDVREAGDSGTGIAPSDFSRGFYFSTCTSFWRARGRGAPADRLE
jgi:hypothetical protein